MVLRQDLISQLPGLKKKYLHYRDYSEQTMKDIFTDKQLESAIVSSAKVLETTLWMNTGKGTFVKKVLPIEAQFSTVYDILIDDYNGDDIQDIMLAGNLYRAKPETGIYDGSYGLLLKGDGSGNFRPLRSSESGVFITGEVRALKPIRLVSKRMVIVGRNSDSPIAFRIN